MNALEGISAQLAASLSEAAASGSTASAGVVVACFLEAAEVVLSLSPDFRLAIAENGVGPPLLSKAAEAMLRFPADALVADSACRLAEVLLAQGLAPPAAAATAALDARLAAAVAAVLRTSPGARSARTLGVIWVQYLCDMCLYGRAGVAGAARDAAQLRQAQEHAGIGAEALLRAAAQAQTDAVCVLPATPTSQTITETVLYHLVVAEQGRRLAAAPPRAGQLAAPRLAMMLLDATKGGLVEAAVMALRAFPLSAAAQNCGCDLVSRIMRNDKAAAGRARAAGATEVALGALRRYLDIPALVATVVTNALILLEACLSSAAAGDVNSCCKAAAGEIELFVAALRAALVAVAEAADPLLADGRHLPAAANAVRSSAAQRNDYFLTLEFACSVLGHVCGGEPRLRARAGDAGAVEAVARCLTEPPYCHDARVLNQACLAVCALTLGCPVNHRRAHAAGAAVELAALAAPTSPFAADTRDFARQALDVLDRPTGNDALAERIWGRGAQSDAAAERAAALAQKMKERAMSKKQAAAAASGGSSSRRQQQQQQKQEGGGGGDEDDEESARAARLAAELIAQEAEEKAKREAEEAAKAAKKKANNVSRKGKVPAAAAADAAVAFAEGSRKAAATAPAAAPAKAAAAPSSASVTDVEAPPLPKAPLKPPGHEQPPPPLLMPPAEEPPAPAPAPPTPAAAAAPAAPAATAFAQAAVLGAASPSSSGSAQQQPARASAQLPSFLAGFASPPPPAPASPQPQQLPPWLLPAAPVPPAGAGGPTAAQGTLNGAQQQQAAAPPLPAYLSNMPSYLRPPAFAAAAASPAAAAPAVPAMPTAGTPSAAAAGGYAFGWAAPPSPLQQAGAAMPPSSSSTFAAASTASSAAPDLDANDCVVCLDARRTHAMVPCGHFCACADWCAPRWHDCSLPCDNHSRPGQKNSPNGTVLEPVLDVPPCRAG